jgi:prepilin-type N-terminal cleavage/methylation domain-containing protein
MKKIKGFTLIELLVVIAIMAILTAVVFSTIGRIKADKAKKEQEQHQADKRSDQRVRDQQNRQKTQKQQAQKQVEKKQAEKKQTQKQDQPQETQSMQGLYAEGEKPMMYDIVTASHPNNPNIWYANRPRGVVVTCWTSHPYVTILWPSTDGGPMTIENIGLATLMAEWCTLVSRKPGHLEIENTKLKAEIERLREPKTSVRKPKRAWN